MRIHALTGGYLDVDATSFFADGTTRPRWTVPIPCWLVVHPRGTLLFDTGVHRGRARRSGGRGSASAARGALRHPLRRRRRRRQPARAARPRARTTSRYVVNSHLHFDHCGGNEFFPASTFLVQQREMDAARRVLAGEAMQLQRRARIDFDHPLDYQLVDGEHDLFGRRPGRAPADLRPHPRAPSSVLVRLGGRGTELVLTADACYTRENMDRDILPNRALGPRGDVALAGRAPGLARQERRDGHLRPRRRPVAGDLRRAPAAL